MSVQFGNNNWIQRVPLTAKLDLQPDPIFSELRILFHPIISKSDKHVILLTIQIII